MKLELKHIAGYFHYGLTGISTEENLGIETVKGFGTYGKENTIYLITDIDDIDLVLFKPILRPLSDLVKEIDINEQNFVPINRLRKDYSGFFFENNPELLIKSKNTNLYIPLNWGAEFQQKLYEWHFDVHGLIENNLAIDIKTLLCKENQ